MLHAAMQDRQYEVKVAPQRKMTGPMGGELVEFGSVKQLRLAVPQGQASHGLRSRPRRVL